MAAKYPASAQSPLQICFQDGVPIGFRKIERGHFFRATGAIYEDLHAAEFSAHGLQEPLDAGVVSDIASLRERSFTERHYLRGSVSNLLRPTARGHDVRSGLGQTAGERQSDAAGSADDHGGLVCEIEKRMTHEVLLRFLSCRDLNKSANANFTRQNCECRDDAL